MTTALGIAEVAESTGLTRDTLRWYEREGLIPRVNRGSDGRRRYDDVSLRMIQLVVRLRRTGMPVAEIRRFLALYNEGAASHGRRMALLLEHRERVLAQRAQLDEDLGAIDDKIEHYRGLIDRGLDCTETPITDPILIERQGDFL
ncbi:MerR family transcriptional regulator [Rhodococcus sp. D2-41]|uniref:MerR family transcriptional regulator n=1 Tax=Speluncibacter jeojiensis TaxID=2710754 RepID=A0A9X4M0B7_9ACTN|nr:MerR family transcriptional regulator [Rhodococcus sp. D2-41]MDG3009728.1 MerR family transcriptional regulator [Rhodococcus sp. D2-41]MDG3014477.1 MerR family transcriptional regulator [Corynebacteriales bacterium D3-21]